MSFWAIFLVLHFASLICGNPLFGCYKGGGTSELIHYLHPLKKIIYITYIIYIFNQILHIT